MKLFPITKAPYDTCDFSSSCVLYSEEVAGRRVFRSDVIRLCSICGPSVVGSLIRIQPDTWRRRVGLHHDCCLNVFSAARKTLFVAGRGAGVPGAPLLALLRSGGGRERRAASLWSVFPPRPRPPSSSGNFRHGRGGRLRSRLFLSSLLC